MPEFERWTDLLRLSEFPILAINVTNNASEHVTREEHYKFNKKCIDHGYAEAWPLPEGVPALCLRRAVLLFVGSRAGDGVSTIYAGTTTGVSMKTKSAGRLPARWKIDVAGGWKEVGTANVPFARFFGGLIKNVRRVSHWLDANPDGETLPDVDESASSEEGRRLWRHHLARERRPEIVRRKKASVKAEKGELRCEVCDFSFQEKYGAIGEDFCEVHHKVPLAKGKSVRRTTIGDLAVLCSNCHRMIHKTDPLLSPDRFRKRIAAP